MVATRPARKVARLQTEGATPEHVRAMLQDIATVLALTSKVKAEIVRDQAEADHRRLIELRMQRAAKLAEAAS